MAENDLTILYITANEMPQRWVDFQLDHFLKAAGGYPIISISRKPMSLGNNLLDTEPKSYWNIYMQMLRGSLLATTPFVAVAEDDTLYTRGHFEEYRPPLDHVSYDRSRWSLFTWDNIYCLRQRVSNCSLIAPREYLIECLTERKEKWKDQVPPDHLLGEVGRPVVERRLCVKIRAMIEWYSYSPIVQLNHPTGTDDRQQRKWKRHGQIKAFDIPFWGKASDIVRIYNEH